MDDADLSDEVSTLGKRAAAGDHVAGTGGEADGKAMVVYTNMTNPADCLVSGTPKKRKTSGSLDGQQTQHSAGRGDARPGDGGQG